MSKFYAVRLGRVPGIYRSWAECESNTKGFSGAIFKSFSNRTDAEDFINCNGIKNTITKDMEGKKVWTDGSFKDGRAGYAVISEESQINYGPVEPATNNRAELTAILKALEIYSERPLIIHSDSRYSIQTLTEWLPNWKRRYGSDPTQWRTASGDLVSNTDLLIKIAPLLKNVKLIHVRAHQGNHFNEMADRWANAGRMCSKDVMFSH